MNFETENTCAAGIPVGCRCGGTRRNGKNVFVSTHECGMDHWNSKD
jgi:hypothetical protein